ncbi:glycoside hydrolase family 79 protein [Amanita muscaria Koide BX008]|uniref:Glycoside hydrolase family 79 protein n=1 Tax=Amanita muscaria (strain Koide BX008) TaxID=946122 RepID=A0A0C2SM52_AMAMK|nr:glycoside hydrolase family 79 protein [Amanita muscaria Koide BX008]
MFAIRHWLYLGRILSFWLLLTAQIHKACAITVYYEKGYNPQAALTATASGANYTGPAAYNPTTLQVPPVPTGFPTQVNAQILDGSAPPGSSIPLMSSFFGFSIEMSVVDQVLGRSSQLLNVPFLNLMANLVRRSGRVNIRVGGNTQETAVLVQNTTTGKLLQKDYNNTLGTTNSPPIHYKEDLLYIMSNISSFLNVRWFLAILTTSISYTTASPS